MVNFEHVITAWDDSDVSTNSAICCEVRQYEGSQSSECNRGGRRTQSNIYDGVFCQHSKQLLAVNYFRKKAPS